MTSDTTGAGAQDTGARPVTDATEQGLVTVRLLGLPLPVQARAQEHSDELIRELTLVGEQMRQQGNHAGLPARLVTLVEQLTAEYSAFTGEQEQQVAEAAAAGRPTIDLDYRVPASTAEAVQALEAILDEADEYCRAGQHLLTLPTPPDLVVYRRWFLDQFARQIRGGQPLSYAEYVERETASRTAAATRR
jgi:hypothetical protein